jgi:hypothetical protein
MKTPPFTTQSLEREAIKTMAMNCKFDNTGCKKNLKIPTFTTQYHPVCAKPL